MDVDVVFVVRSVVRVGKNRGKIIVVNGIVVIEVINFWICVYVFFWNRCLVIIVIIVGKGWSWCWGWVIIKEVIWYYGGLNVVVIKFIKGFSFDVFMIDSVGVML